jgi:hypothetical protein
MAGRERSAVYVGRRVMRVKTSGYALEAGVY